MPSPQSSNDAHVPPAEWRLPADTRLGRVALQIGDLDRSLDYYQQVLGLRLLERGETGASLGTHGDERVLIELHQRPEARPSAPRSRLGLYHFAILLPERAALGRFLRHLAELGVRVGMSDHLVSEALYLTDPDGLGIEVYADRPRSEWPRSGEAVAMSSDPLDVDGLMSAGGDEPWRGVPAGGVIGHVHLHVGDLEQAERFYHRGLGFDVSNRLYPGALFLSAGGYHHHLGVNTWARGARPAERNEARLLFWEIVVAGEDEVRAAAAALQGLGVESSGGGDRLRVVDPWGTEVRLRTEMAAQRRSTGDEGTQRERQAHEPK